MHAANAALAVVVVAPPVTVVAVVFVELFPHAAATSTATKATTASLVERVILSPLFCRRAVPVRPLVVLPAPTEN